MKNSKNTGAAIVGALVGCGLMTLTAQGGAEKKVEATELRAQRFVLQGADGKTRGEFSMTKKGPALTMLDKSGKTRFRVTLEQERSGDRVMIHVAYPDGQRAIQVGAGRNFSPTDKNKSMGFSALAMDHPETKTPGKQHDKALALLALGRESGAHFYARNEKGGDCVASIMTGGATVSYKPEAVLTFTRGKHTRSRIRFDRKKARLVAETVSSKGGPITATKSLTLVN